MIEVTRNIVMYGNSPTSGPAIASKAALAVGEDELQQVSRSAGTSSMSATVRGSRRGWASTRAAPARFPHKAGRRCWDLQILT
ncbi:MAG TPA: hypothetical protein VK279_00785, partial [Solirubrobacteraceae bacterium]|nr:hypothetical protein [Solirubrobacteraceae bacterium]